MKHFHQLTNGSTTNNSPGAVTILQTHQAGLDERLDQQATVSWLQHQISTLPGPQREALVLSTIQGLRMKEIAAILKLPENTVKTHLRRARLALAESLAKRESQPMPAGGKSL